MNEIISDGSNGNMERGKFRAVCPQRPTSDALLNHKLPNHIQGWRIILLQHQVLHLIKVPSFGFFDGTETEDLVLHFRTLKGEQKVSFNRIFTNLNSRATNDDSFLLKCFDIKESSIICDISFSCPGYRS